MNAGRTGAAGSLRDAVDAVVFDVGETLLCEDGAWTAWATWFGVRPSLLFAALGTSIAARGDHRDALRMVRPDVDVAEEVRAMHAAGGGWRFGPDDLYPDALECLARLRAAGLRVGVAGNQPRSMETMLETLDLPVDFVGSSGRWGVHKPDPAFFARVVEAAGCAPERIAYVGDRVDNDVLPAKAAGMLSVFVVRGPWGIAHASWPEAAEAHVRAASLDEVADLFAR